MSGTPAGDPAAPTPADDDQVLVRYGDLVGLQRSLDIARQNTAEAIEDLRAIATALALDIDEALTPHQVITQRVLPKINQLMVTQGFVDAAEHEMRERLDVRGLGPEIPLGGGRAMRLAGKRLPAEMTKDIRRGPRRR